MNRVETKFSLSRRQFLVNSAAVSALLMLTACPSSTPAGEEAALAIAGGSLAPASAAEAVLAAPDAIPTRFRHCR